MVDVEAGYVHPKDRPGYNLETEDQIKNFVLEQVTKVESLREKCDVPGAEMHEVLAREQRKAHTEYRMWYGHTLGCVVMAHRLKKISDVCYNELLNRLAQTVRPTLII